MISVGMDFGQSGSLEGRRALVEESLESAETFIKGLDERIQIRAAMRNRKRAELKLVEEERRDLGVKLAKLEGLQLSQESRQRKEIEVVKSNYKLMEDNLQMAVLENERKLKFLQEEVRRLHVSQKPSEPNMKT